ncbi:MAG: tRNA lysidine(34) synthetase TilS [Acidobacteria bacterium]|nr:tRNA lysidine(34) synthetase TilS [Acidobacteriota bacterium]MCA1637720.1 tRNA lysidine(34) synthetase TilS [Acidobacteriota bacterium]
MDNFTRNLLTEWRRLKLPFADAIFIVAVSGGADSVSLLLALHELRKRKKLNLRFVTAHFNHNLRGEESERDEEFVKNLANDLQFELALKKGKISDDGNLEQSARIARYEFLVETAENLHADGILTAHTLNDQAETFLLNLIRGSGLEGLCGIKAIRNFEFKVQSSEFKVQSLELENLMSDANDQSKILLVRPLLGWAKREDTENFCHLNEIEFRYDTMNEDLAFKRVRVRKVLIPLLEDFNPKIIETLAQTAFILQKDFETLKSISFRADLDEEEKNNKKREENLKIKDFKELFPSMRQYFLREWLKEQRGNLRGLNKKHFEAIESLIFSRKSGKKAELPNNEFLLKERGSLIFVKNKG